MSVLRTIKVTFTCDGCGKQEVVALPSDMPKSWSWMEMTSEVEGTLYQAKRLDACDKYCLVRGLEKLLKIDRHEHQKTKAGFFAPIKPKKRAKP